MSSKRDLVQEALDLIDEEPQLKALFRSISEEPLERVETFLAFTVIQMVTDEGTPKHQAHVWTLGVKGPGGPLYDLTLTLDLKAVSPTA